jgi:hypothetical protein
MQITASSSWVELPDSRYDIVYTLEKPKGGASSNRNRLPLRARNTLGIKRGAKKPSRGSPFERMLDNLNLVTRRFQYPEGTAIMYIREIFEPSDPEFDVVGAKVNSSQLSQEQVDRLRIMIVPERREEILVAYLDYYSIANRRVAYLDYYDMASKRIRIFIGSTHVVRHFDGFERRYASTRDPKEKFDLLFGFSFAIKKYSAWMYRYEGARSRKKMLTSLARHWRNLLENPPQELGLDEEFSHPALLAFLRGFKRQAESIETFGDTPIKFEFEAQEIHISFDDVSVSTMTMDEESDPALLAFLRGFKRQAESIETYDDTPIKFGFEAQEIHISFDDVSVSIMTIDEESDPALAFLQGFKRQAESIETLDNVPIKFVFEAQEIQISFDDISVSTMTMSVNSKFSI